MKKPLKYNRAEFYLLRTSLCKERFCSFSKQKGNYVQGHATVSLSHRAFVRWQMLRQLWDGVIDCAKSFTTKQLFFILPISLFFSLYLSLCLFMYLYLSLSFSLSILFSLTLLLTVPLLLSIFSSLHYLNFRLKAMQRNYSGECLSYHLISSDYSTLVARTDTPCRGVSHQVQNEMKPNKCIALKLEFSGKILVIFQSKLLIFSSKYSTGFNSKKHVQAFNRRMASKKRQIKIEKKNKIKILR